MPCRYKMKTQGHRLAHLEHLQKIRSIIILQSFTIAGFMKIFLQCLNLTRKRVLPDDPIKKKIENYSKYIGAGHRV